MKAIALSLFGYNQEHKNCFTFGRFLKYLSIDIRAYSVIYPGWKICLMIEGKSYLAYKPYFDCIQEAGASIYFFDYETLCKSMLWRLYPVQFAEYTICRDIDCIPTYREKKAVDQWIKNGTIAHAMNDHVQHTVPLLGGMIGFRMNAFPYRLWANTSFDLVGKGTDQYFLQHNVYPRVQKSITRHITAGMPLDTENKYCYSTIEPTEEKADKYITFIGEPYNMNKVIDGESCVDFWKNRCNKALNAHLEKTEKKYPEIFNGYMD
jgi:hypothetical protein